MGLPASEGGLSGCAGRRFSPRLTNTPQSKLEREISNGSSKKRAISSSVCGTVDGCKVRKTEPQTCILGRRCSPRFQTNLENGVQKRVFKRSNDEVPVSLPSLDRASETKLPNNDDNDGSCFKRLSLHMGLPASEGLLLGCARRRFSPRFNNNPQSKLEREIFNGSSKKRTISSNVCASVDGCKVQKTEPQMCILGRRCSPRFQTNLENGVHKLVLKRSNDEVFVSLPSLDRASETKLPENDDNDGSCFKRLSLHMGLPESEGGLSGYARRRFSPRLNNDPQSKLEREISNGSSKKRAISSNVCASVDGCKVRKIEPQTCILGRRCSPRFQTNLENGVQKCVLKRSNDEALISLRSLDRASETKFPENNVHEGSCFKRRVSPRFQNNLDSQVKKDLPCFGTNNWPKLSFESCKKIQTRQMHKNSFGDFNVRGGVKREHVPPTNMKNNPPEEFIAQLQLNPENTKRTDVSSVQRRFSPRLHSKVESKLTSNAYKTRDQRKSRSSFKFVESKQASNGKSPKSEVDGDDKDGVGAKRIKFDHSKEEQELFAHVKDASREGNEFDTIQLECSGDTSPDSTNYSKNLNLCPKEDQKRKDDALTPDAATEGAHLRVKNTLRKFNALYLQFVKEEEERCKKSVGDHKQNKGSKPKNKEALGENLRRSTKRPDLKALSHMRQTKAILYPERQIGNLPGIDVGYQFFSRAEMVAVGLHSHWLNGIDYMGSSYRKRKEFVGYTFPLAVAIVLSGQYEDDLDESEEIVYTGEGGNDLLGNKHQIKDQVMVRGNLALKNNMKQSKPVRVIRGNECDNSYCGKVYTYDGLYQVVDCLTVKGVSGFTVFQYRLKRLQGQPKLTTNQVQYVRGGAAGFPSELPGLICSDISNGQENICIPLTNLIDDPPVGPTEFAYCKTIDIAKNVTLPPKGAGCNCKQNCTNPKTCACAKLNGLDFPYVRRGGGRLVQAKDIVFECGPNCGCGPGCINRTSQQGLRYQLEVYRTPHKGWAVRSWDFIPSGAPVCEYIGVLRRTDEVDSVSENDYIFEIDCWHTMNEFEGRERRYKDIPASSTRLLHPSSNKTLDNTPEFCIDAGLTGNVSRFINHSCEPNLFVQCILSSHHDIRQARIVLFAADNIPPLQELTYDYGYALNSVVGSDGKIKTLPCYCGAPNCRKRLY